MLKVENLKVRYGMIEAIKGISFEVRDGEIVTLIGANGAGKTTTMHAISGLIKAAEGSISLDGKELTKIPAHKIVGLGLAQVPEGRRVFAQQTVEENLILGAYLRRDQGAIAKDIEDVYQTFPRLGERRTQLAGTLSGGEQQMLAMGRALMAKPSILLLDEPSMGLSPLLVSEIFQIIEEINKKGTTILLVEQNAKRALSIADRAYVLETGRITLDGTGEGLARDERVRKAYLGGYELWSLFYSVKKGNSVKNHTDVLIFHTAICAGASQIAVMAEEKPHSRISLRPVAQSAPEWRLVCT